MERVPRWRKSSFSGNDANCVEVAWNWRMSSFSANDANCVELAWSGADAAIRDSKHPDAGHLAVPSRAFTYLLDTARKSPLSN